MKVPSSYNAEKLLGTKSTRRDISINAIDNLDIKLNI